MALEKIIKISEKEWKATTEEIVSMWRMLKAEINRLLLEAGHDEATVKAMHTKFNDAGRRSAPWKPFSSKVPGRPQDGKDGNRINRWLLPKDHKFYATEKDATLVQIKYYLQTLSMKNAPEFRNKEFEECFIWLAGHKILPGEYKDPIQLTPIDMKEFFENLRSITSGHLIPLDRGGKHIPQNTFLMLHRSNVLQGNLTLEELINLLKSIVSRHEKSA